MSDVPAEPPAIEAPADPPAVDGGVHPTTVLWAGEQVTFAVRKFPIVGEVASTTTIHTLARVTVGDDGSYTLVDTPCAMTIVQDGPLDLAFAEDAVRRLPSAVTTFVPTDATDASADLSDDV